MHYLFLFSLIYLQGLIFPRWASNVCGGPSRAFIVALGLFSVLHQRYFRAHDDVVFPNRMWSYL